MDDQNVYEPPKAEGFELGKFESFGGWLRFYQVINILSLAIVAFAIAMIAFFQFSAEYELSENADVFAALLEFLPGLIFAIMILRILTTRNKDVPNKIIKYLGYYVTASLVIYAIVYYLFHTEIVVEKPSSFWGSVIYYWIWSSYFKKSKRVKVYYGDNAVV